MIKKSGIYRIVNKKNNKIYIGQSSQVGHRKQQHWKKLLIGKHSNKHLQKDFLQDKIYFSFEIVEFCDKKLLNDREIYWISFYNACNPTKGYNKLAGGGVKRKDK